MAVRLSALRAGRALPPRNLPGTHFCQRLSRTQGHSAAGRIRSIEKNPPHWDNFTSESSYNEIVVVLVVVVAVVAVLVVLNSYSKILELVGVDLQVYEM
jgi:hypothetical protein